MWNVKEKAISAEGCDAERSISGSRLSRDRVKIRERERERRVERKREKLGATDGRQTETMIDASGISFHFSPMASDFSRKSISAVFPFRSGQKERLIINGDPSRVPVAPSRVLSFANVR